MHFLLVEPSPSKTWGVNNQYVGLLRIANYLLSTGNTVEWVRYPSLPKSVPDEIYCTSMFTYDYPAVFEAVSLYKGLFPNTKLTLGGIYATLCPDHALTSGADEVFIGQHNEAKMYPPDPRVLPYTQDFAYLFTSYGCDRTCTFCASRILFKDGLRQVDSDHVLDELKYLRGIGFREVWFGDDNILANKDNHIKPICEKIIIENLGMRFRIPGGMSAKDLDMETATLMKRAGVMEFSFGFESADKDVRKKMGRGNHTDNYELIRAIEVLDSLGYSRDRMVVFFMVGLPYQKKEDMIDTLTFLLKLGVEVRPQRLTPIPGTAEWKRMGLQDYDFTDLHYLRFVAPDQDNFTHDDLQAIMKIARGITMSRRYIDWIYDKNISDKTSVPELFRKSLISNFANQ